MNFDCTDKELFEMHAEFNQLYGMLLGTIMHNENYDRRTAELFSEKGFPKFCKMVN